MNISIDDTMLDMLVNGTIESLTFNHNGNILFLVKGEQNAPSDTA